MYCRRCAGMAGSDSCDVLCGDCTTANISDINGEQNESSNVSSMQLFHGSKEMASEQLDLNSNEGVKVLGKPGTSRLHLALDLHQKPPAAADPSNEAMSILRRDSGISDIASPPTTPKHSKEMLSSLTLPTPDSGIDSPSPISGSRLFPKSRSVSCLGTICEQPCSPQSSGITTLPHSSTRSTVPDLQTECPQCHDKCTDWEKQVENISTGPQSVHYLKIQGAQSTDAQRSDSPSGVDSNTVECNKTTGSDVAVSGDPRQSASQSDDSTRDRRLHGEKESGIYRQAQNNHITKHPFDERTALDYSNGQWGITGMLEQIQRYGQSNFKEKNSLITEIEECFTSCLQPSEGAQATDDVMENTKALLRHYGGRQDGCSCQLCRCVEVLIKSHFYPEHSLCGLIPCQKMQKYVVAKQSQRRQRLSSLSYATDIQSPRLLSVPIVIDDAEKLEIFKKSIGDIFGIPRLSAVDSGSLSSAGSHFSSMRGRPDQSLTASESQDTDKPSTTIAILDEDADVRAQDVPIADNPVIYCDVDEISHRAACWEELKLRFRDDTVILTPHEEAEGCILRVYKKVLCIRNGSYRRTHEWGIVVGMHLGRGGMGSCVLACDTASKFTFCAKEIHLSMFNLNEIQVWGKLKHPNIALFMGALRENDNITLLTEFVDGGNLLERINGQGKGRGLCRAEYIPYMRDVLEGLIYLHTEQYCLHEDIKANNIMLDLRRNQCKLIDFGLARQLDTEHPYVPRHTSPVGGVTQASPEKAASEEYGFPADIWAFACTFIHVVSGYMPWEKRYRGYKVLVWIIKQYSPPLQDIPLDCPGDVREFIRLALTIDPHARPDAVTLSKHSIFSRPVEEEEAPPTPAAVRSNPRLVAITTDSSVLNSVPCDPPSTHYRPPVSALHSSIPDLSVLRQDSEEGDNEGEVDDTSQQTDGGHFDDGLSDDDEVCHSDDNYRVDDQGQFVPVVNPAWANVPAPVANEMADQGISDMYQYQMTALFGTSPQIDKKDTKEKVGDIAEHDDTNIRKLLDSLPLLGIENTAEGTEAIDGIVIESEIDKDSTDCSESQTTRHSNTVKDFDLSNQLETYSRRRNQNNESTSDDKTMPEQNEQKRKHGGEESRSQTLDSLEGEETGGDLRTQESSNDFPGVYYDNGAFVEPQAEDTPIGFPLSFNYDDTYVAHGPIELPSALPHLVFGETFQSATSSFNFRGEQPVRQEATVPDIPILHEDELELPHNPGIGSAGHQAPSNPEELLETLRREFAEASLQDSANADIASQLSDFHSSLIEKQSNGNINESAVTEKDLQAVQDQVESMSFDIQKKGTLVKFQKQDGSTIVPLRIQYPFQYTWNDLRKDLRDQLDEAVPNFVLLDVLRKPLNLAETIPANQTVVVIVIPLTDNNSS